LVTLSKYILKEFLKVFGITYSLLLVLCLIFDFLEQWDVFLKYRAPMDLALLCFLYRVPLFMLYAIPMAVLLANFLSLGIMSKNNEITAMKVSGISNYRIATPLILASFIISIFSFGFGEWVVPPFSKRSFYIKKVEIKKEVERSFFRENGIWFKSKDAIYNFDMIEYPDRILPSPLERKRVDQVTLKGIVICYFDQDFSLVRRIDAKMAIYRDGTWVFYKGLITDIEQNRVIRAERFEEKAISIPQRPSDFQVPESNTEEMGFFELKRYSKKLKREGHDPVRYLTDMHAKISFSFFSLILTILAIPIALRTGQKGGNIALGIALSLAIAFIYYVVMALGLAVGHTGTLPPFIAAWISNILFGLIGIFQMMSMR
jgi:lipopolysaccharide export system permease protein